mgnify:FL=1
MPTTLGTVLPVTVPQLSDQANIVTALQQLYYGTGSIPTTPSGLYSTTNSIGGYIQQLFTDKANYTDKLSVFASTTSAELASKISDETGSGSLVFATSPTLVTPVLGVATATSINGTAIPSSKTLVTTADTATVTNTMLAGSIANSKLSNSTISGVSLGNSLNALSAGAGLTLTGGYDGSATKTITVDSTVIRTATSPSDGYVIAWDGALNSGAGGITWQSVDTLPGTIENAIYATNATNIGIANDTTTATSVYPTWVTATTGNLPVKTASTKLSFVPSTGILTATGFAGLFNGLTLTAGTTGFTISGGTTSRTLSVTGASNATVSGTNTGDQTISLTGDVSATGGTGALTTTIGAGKVTNDMLAGSIANTKLLNNSITFGTTAQALGSTITNIAGVTINSTTIPNSKTLVTIDSTTKIAAPTSGNADSATSVVSFGGSSGTMSYGTSSQRIYVGATAPTGLTSADIGSIWMW